MAPESQENQNTPAERLAQIEGLFGKPEILRLSVLLPVLIFALVVGLTLLSYAFRVARQAQARTLQAKLADLQKQLALPEKAALDKTAQNLRLQIEVLKGTARTKTGSSYLKELQRLTPKEVRLTSFSVSEQGKVALEGRTGSILGVAKLAVALEGSEEFVSPKVTSLAFVGSPEGREVSFRLSLTVKGAKP